jgi:hypothetical protein
MRNWKISLCSLFIVLCSFGTTYAVDLPKQGFGLQIGWAQSVLRVNDPYNYSTKDSLSQNIHLNGFKVGILYDASYIAGFGSTIGLNYTFGINNGGWEQTYKNNDLLYNRVLVNYSELELFVDWQYKFEIAKETYLMLTTGPTLQCGLVLGWRKDIREEDFYTGERKITYGDWSDGYKADKDDPDPNVANSAFKRVNVTWGVGAGFQYKRYFLRGGYDFGLIVPYKNTDFTDGFHTRGRLDQWSIKIGMYFWYEE